MSKYDDLKKRLETSIPKIGDILRTVSADEILIAEYEKNSTAYVLSNVDWVNKTCVIEENLLELNEAKVFRILHSSMIDFIPVDGKKGLIGNSSHCDFVFYDEHSFCFVELKLNALSEEERAVRKNRKKAVEQLTETLDYFDTVCDKDYSGLNVEAYVATPDVYPCENAAWQSIKVKFLETTGIHLFESREKRC